MANPNSTPANITLTLRDNGGNTLATKSVVVAALNQSAQFVTELFANQPSVPQDVTGTLEIVSNIPIAVIGIRFRGVNFSTLPVRDLSVPHPVPVISPGVGGPTAIILPQFATGGGWATEIVIANTGASELTVRVDLFTSGSLPLSATLNGESKSSFTNIKIPKLGVVTLAPRDNMGDSDF